MTVGLLNQNVNKIYELCSSISILESDLIKKRKEMFVELLCHFSDSENYDSKLLGKLFHTSEKLALSGDLRAKFCMADFYAGKYGDSVVTPDLFKALKYVDIILVEKPAYPFAIKVCENFKSERRAFFYAIMGLTSVKTDGKVKADLAKYVVKNYINGNREYRAADISSIVILRKACNYFEEHSVDLGLEDGILEKFSEKLLKRNVS